MYKLKLFFVLISYFTEDVASNLVMDFLKKVFINHTEVKRDGKQNDL